MTGLQECDTMLSDLTLGGEHMEEDMITPQETAEILGYHLNHVYRLLKQGKIKGEKKYRVWLIDREEVIRLKAMQDEHGRLLTED